MTPKGQFKTECKYGHPLSGDNVFTSSGIRRCRQCQRRWAAEQAVKRRIRKVRARNPVWFTHSEYYS